MSINPPPPLNLGRTWIGTERRDYIERTVFRLTGYQLQQCPVPDDDETNLIIGSMADLIAMWPSAEPKPMGLTFAVADSAGSQFRDVADFLNLTVPELVFVMRLIAGVTDPGPTALFHSLNLLWSTMLEAQGDNSLETPSLIALLRDAEQEAKA